MLNNKHILLILVAFLLLGAGLMVWAGSVSLRETGGWFGDRLPNHVIALGAIGLCILIFSTLGFLAFAILSFTEWAPVSRILHSEVLPEHHFLARVGRLVLRAAGAWEMLMGVALCGLLVAGGVYVGGIAGWIVVGLVVSFVALVLYSRRAQHPEEPGDEGPHSH